jgi:hypothetical protein
MSPEREIGKSRLGQTNRDRPFTWAGRDAVHMHFLASHDMTNFDDSENKKTHDISAFRR